MTRVAVVGHVEWVDFALVDHLPEQGQIVEGHDVFADAAGGGGVAAVQIARLLGECVFVTALGDDDVARKTREALAGHRVTVRAAVRAGTPTRRALTQIDGDGERTITTLGERLVPHADDGLQLGPFDAIYLTGGDPDMIRAARDATGVLVATPRAMPALDDADVVVDALVASANDTTERAAVERLEPDPRTVVLTAGKDGGEWRRDGEAQRWDAAELPGEPVDAYGAGDTFAATLAVALGAGLGIDDAVAYAGRCGAMVLTGRGPYGAPLEDVGPPA